MDAFSVVLFVKNEEDVVGFRVDDDAGWVAIDAGDKASFVELLAYLNAFALLALTADQVEGEDEGGKRSSQVEHDELMTAGVLWKGVRDYML